MMTTEHMTIAHNTLLQLAERPRVHVPVGKSEVERQRLREALHNAAVEDEVSLRINTVEDGFDVALRRRS